MPRPRQRVCLEQGLKLDLSKLTRQGWVQPGAKTGPHLIRWTYIYTGEEIARGLITANMEGLIPKDIEAPGWIPSTGASSWLAAYLIG